MVTATGRVYPIVDRQTGEVTGARSQRGRPLWPWEHAANERTFGPWRMKFWLLSKSRSKEGDGNGR